VRVAQLAQIAPFPWSSFFHGAELAELDRVVLAEASAIPEIAAVYARTPIATVKAWQAFHLVDAVAPYLSNRFVTAKFQFHEQTLRGVARLAERWKRGVRLVESEMGEAIGRVCVSRYFTTQAKALVNEMVAQILLAMKERIELLAWMTSETKYKALDKLSHLRVKSGYPNEWREMNGDLTIGENIADLGGVLVAFDAYRRSLAGRSAPVLNGFTGDQRFFLSYAQSFRAKRTDEATRQLVVSDSHPPEQYRVNGIVRNVDAGYQAFNVQRGDRLYLANENRVRIW
jgi:predicted metalloendopeptidase